MAAALLIWLFPAGFDVRGDQAACRWTCLFPGLVIFGSVVVAVLLPLVFLADHRAARALPDGRLVTSFSVGAGMPIVLIDGYFFAMNPAYRKLCMAEA